MKAHLAAGAPAKLALAALGLVLVFGLAHGAGLRDAVGFLSTGASRDAPAGLIYVTAYFAAVLLGPPLFFAAALLLLVRYRGRRRRTP